MNYTVSVNEAKRTIEVVIEGKYKGVAKCCASDNYNLQTGIELALERAKVAKANAEKPKAKTVADMSVRELAAIIERKLRKGEVVVIGEGRVPSASQKAVLHSYTDCKGGITKEELEEKVNSAYDEGYADGYADAVDEYDEEYDEDCDCDEGCDCECECHNAVGGVVVISGSGGSIGGAMVRKMIEEYERKMRK
jgi:hypothetical protein